MRLLTTHLLLLLCFTLIACVLLYPLPLYLSNGLLAAQSGDPLLQIWVIQWNIHKLTSSLTNYFDANIFYPYSNTFAYHDHLFVLSVLGLPIFTLTHNPILTYNLLLILSFVLSAYGMYLFTHELTGNGDAAFLAGLIFGFLPYRFAHLDHLNLLSIQWLPLCLLFLTRYLFLKQRTTAKVACLLAGFWSCYLLQVLTSFNYLFMLTYIIGIVLVGTLVFQWKYAFRLRATTEIFAFRTRREMLLFIAGGCLVGLLLLPFGLPYFRANQEMGFQRTLEEATLLSARIQDYLVAPQENLLYGKLTQRFASPTSPFPREQILFGGLIPTILAIWGVVSMFVKLKLHDRFQRFQIVRLTYLVLLLIAALLSLGPFFVFQGKTLSLPYLWLYHIVPGFQSMRVPARFAVLVFFAMAVLAALGMTQILTSLQRHRWFSWPTLKQTVLTGVVSSLILLEYASLSKPLSFYPGTQETIPAVYRWLAQQPEDIRIIELPLDSVKANFEYTYYSTFHWKRLVNGRSAFIPEGTNYLFNAMQTFPSEISVNVLKTLGVHYIIVHTAQLAQAFLSSLPQELEIIQQFGDDLVLTMSDRDSEAWENSGKFVTHILAAQPVIPSMLRPGEMATGAIELHPQASPFCTLPYQRAHIDLEWTAQNGERFTDTREIQFPILIEQDASIALTFVPPGKSGEYELTVQTKHPLFMEHTQSFPVTVSAEIPDSRHPGKLLADFLKIELPDVGESGKLLPIRVIVRNSGDTLWKADVQNRTHPVGEVHLAVTDWRERTSGESLKVHFPQLLLSRGFLPYDVAPGEEVRIDMLLRTPEVAGEFEVELDMVSELIQWFSTSGSATMTQKITLKEVGSKE
ncbi:hypothetical protein U27_01877 [Candidatus Vecturithrix granuli]|uniref:Uncharacterized protein n=1 Tax=Vecturithrix granuli TaxID=1499967 RepID=A0A0S6WAW1_VECG1|nr:hypothetical protein U27_01877 [Candidatus Vecturithrix granuli]